LLTKVFQSKTVIENIDPNNYNIYKKQQQSTCCHKHTTITQIFVVVLQIKSRKNIMILIPPSNGKETDLKEKSSDTNTEILVPEVIKSEVNFLVLPFFALWDKDVKRKTRTEYKASVNRGGERLEISWVVSSNAEFGYPGPFDREVHKAIEQIISEFPLPIQNPISVESFYSLCKRMGISSFGGSQYRKIKEALTRIVATTIISKGAFYSKERENWIEDVFHLYERAVFKGERLLNGEIADTNYLFLSGWYLDNINNNYVKPVDWIFYKSLKSPVAQRIYELLSVKFYGLLMKHGKAISYKYSTICELLPITRQKYLSDAKKLLDPSHHKLKETGFLRDWNWEETKNVAEVAENDWLIKYYPGKRARDEIKRFSLGEQLELELPPQKTTEVSTDDPESSIEMSTISAELVQRGITVSSAKKLFRDFPIEQIRKQLEVFDWLNETKSQRIGTNAPGFLRKSIEENYQITCQRLTKKNENILLGILQKTHHRSLNRNPARFPQKPNHRLR
jgi:hypothetical protein